MKIFCDFHHYGLWKSLEFLFEKRLGHELYRPMGMDWYPSWWKIGDPYEGPERTATQYLDTKGHKPDKPEEDGILYYDKMRGVTLEKFKSVQFDIVMASIPEHIKPYQMLIRQYQPDARFILQMGNISWDKTVDFSMVPNLMASTKEFTVPKTCNAVFYHQEFDTNIFKYEPPDYSRRKRISSFINTIESYPEDYALLKEYMAGMDDHQFKLYGASNPDNCVNGEENIAKEMHNSLFGWHLKKGGDGFGHIIHNWFACGRPPIVKMEYYKGKLAGELMEDGVTCIAIDGLSVEEGIKKIRHYSDPAEHEKLAKMAYNKFGSIVDFDREQTEIEEFLERVFN